VPFIRVPTPNVLLSGAETLSFEDLTVRVVHMPGHTQGGVGYVIGDLFFVGDTILPRAVGRADLPGGDAEALRQSIIRGVSQLTERSMLYPGHGEPTNRASLMELNPEVRRVVDEHRMGDPSSEAL
jgi:glyoxylase-like metal-dependent hydrolase (beta-lactamase superfamily II)